MPRFSPLALAVCLIAAPALLHAEVEITLDGSRASMLRQNRIAKLEQYSFLRTPTQVLRFVDSGYLVELAGNHDYRVIAGYPYARPVVRSFVERLAADYRSACGEQLVVTSLTRPAARQPSNASALSVHPAGMAVDLRVSARTACRTWLMSELLELEERGLVDGTLERRPPHFHVAVFPGPYQAYDQTRRAEEAADEAVRRLEAASAARAAAVAGSGLGAGRVSGFQAGQERARAEQVRALLLPVQALDIAAPVVVRVAAALARLVLPLPV